MLISLGLSVIGLLTGNLSVLLIAVVGVFISNLILGFLDWKNHLIFLFFHATLFTFLISRPLIAEIKGYEWWYLGERATAFALTSILLSMVALRFSAVATIRLLNKKHYLEAPPKNEDTNSFFRALRTVSLVVFIIAMGFFLLCEAEKLVYMQDKNYEEYYSTFQSNLPYAVQLMASFMKYALCIFLATLPTKRQAFIPLALYVLSAVPSLIIGVRNPIVLNCIFVLLYYIMRDVIKSKEKWFGKIERWIVVLAVPLGILFLSAYNYIREGTAVEMGFIDSITDFFYKQGVSFDVLCRGFNAIPDLPDVVNKNYTFGGIIDYFSHGSIAQKFFGATDLGTQNSALRAIYGNSFAHSMSFVAHPEYLSGHGWGSSYLLETFADWGYFGIIIFSVFLGAIMCVIPRLLKKGPFTATLTLVALTQFFFIPRAEATGWLTFLTTMQFWVLVVFCFFCALIISNSKIFNRDEGKFAMIKKIGIEEILYGVKKHIALMVALTVVLGTIGFASSSKTANIDVPYNTEYSSSKNYVVNAKDGSTTNNVDGAPNCAYNLSESLKADFTKQYVFEKLKEKYSAEEIIAYTEAGVSTDNLTYTVLNEVIKANVLSGSTIVNFFASTKNLEFSQTITDLLVEYLETTLIPQMSDIEDCTYLGGTDIAIPDEQSVGVTAGSRLLRTIIFAVIGFVLSLIFVLTKVFINPSITDKSDFEAYGLPVIFDKSEFKAQHQEYAADKLFNAIKDGQYETVALVSEVNSSSFKKAKAKLKDTLSKSENLKNHGVTFVNAEGILANIEQLETIKSSGAAILVERKGETYHKNYKNIISQLKDYNIDVIGTMIL